MYINSINFIHRESWRNEISFIIIIIEIVFFCKFSETKKISWLWPRKKRDRVI
jgi:hypothetical protein